MGHGTRGGAVTGGMAAPGRSAAAGSLAAGGGAGHFGRWLLVELCME
jgi:hypothetical protein